MAQFPRFRLTAPAMQFGVQPLNYTPMNLLPAIEQLAKQPQKAAGKETKVPHSDIELKGRIGGVNQIMENVKHYQNQMKTLVDLYGDMAPSMPEWKQANRGLEDAMSLDRTNALDRQTSDVKRFEENIKGKGSFFHIGQFLLNGQMKRAADWKDLQEREYSGELGQEGGYIENFDFDPVFYSLEDARQAADGLYKEAGYKSSKVGSEKITEGFVGNMIGAKQVYNSYMNKQNYNEVDANGKPIGEAIDLTARHQQAMSRAFKQMLDPTDPLAAGYMQGFLQMKNGIKDYEKEDGFDWDNFQKDYQKFVSADLKKHFDGRKVKETDSDQQITFNEQSEYAYNAGANAKVVEELGGAVMERKITTDALTNFGVSTDWLFDNPLEDTEQEKNLRSQYGNEIVDFVKQWMPDTMNDMGVNLGNMSIYDVKSILMNGEHSPFVLNEINGQQVMDVNPNVDYEKLQQLALEQAKNAGHSDPRVFADQVVSAAVQKMNMIEQAKAKGYGVVGTSVQNLTEQFIPTSAVPQTWHDAVNSDDLVGQTAAEFGDSVFGRIGESYFTISDLGENVKYMGTEGTVTMTANTIPTNLSTVIIQNGKPITYKWADPTFIGLPDAEKERIIKLAQEQQQQGVAGAGTALRKNDGNVTDAVEKAYQVPMYDFAQKHLAALANDPTSNLNMLYASPGAVVQQGKYYVKDEKQLAKSLEKVPVQIEVPSTYKTDKNYQKAYDETFGSGAGPLYNMAINEKKGVKNLPNSYKVNTAIGLDELVKMTGLTGAAADRFKEGWTKLPNNLSTAQYQDYIIAAKTNKLTNWNWNKTQPVKTTIKAASNGTIDPRVKPLLGITTTVIKGAAGQEEPGLMFRLPTDVTGAAVRNVRDPTVRKMNSDVFRMLQEKYANKILNTEPGKVEGKPKPNFGQLNAK